MRTSSGKRASFPFSEDSSSEPYIGEFSPHIKFSSAMVATFLVPLNAQKTMVLAKKGSTCASNDFKSQENKR
jgi:hypothetical protein